MHGAIMPRVWLTADSVELFLGGGGGGALSEGLADPLAMRAAMESDHR
jgi:hypothetical protein